MRKKLLGFVFVGALLLGAALPGSALANKGAAPGHVAHGNNADRVVVCHNDLTISVNGNSEFKHMAHGDVAGACA